MKRYLSAFVFGVLLASPVYAQMAAEGMAAAPSPNPITAGEKSAYDMVRGYIVKAAAIAPPAVFAFKATPDVRSFGQIVGHIADSNYMMCSAAAGEKSPGVWPGPTRQQRLLTCS
jgi:hypothetical protein